MSLENTQNIWEVEIKAEKTESALYTELINEKNRTNINTKLETSKLKAEISEANTEVQDGYSIEIKEIFSSIDKDPQKLKNLVNILDKNLQTKTA